MAIYLENIAVDGEITNVLGQLCNYYGYTELKVSAALAPSDYTPFPETILEPLTITLGQLQDQTYMDGIQGQLIKLENVRFNEAGTFASKT